jgi:hypothetical protein
MTKPTHPVELLACAIATEEGWFVAGAMPQVRKNPGDLRFAGQIGANRPYGQAKPIPPIPESIAVFDSNALGITGLFRQLWLQVAEGQTVAQIIGQWAPPSENNTSVYLERVLAWTGLPADVRVLDLLPPLVRLG